MTGPSNPLNSPNAVDRLAALRRMKAAPNGACASPGREVNNHVHTTYSFSPYSPTLAAERACAAGLLAVGVMDHDSVGGAAEMREAGRILGVATTCGVEMRVSADGTALEGRTINNPDSPGLLYVMLHGIPPRGLPLVSRFLVPVQASRERRNRRMVDRLNGVLPAAGIDALDFQKDVYAISEAADGGTITERHILFAVSAKIVAAAGRGPALLAFLRDRLGIPVSGRLEAYLGDAGNPFLLYDLLGLLKSAFLEQVFIQPDAEECVPVAEAVRLAEASGAIPCYGYLGDVTDSPTGDKKAQSFEDSYLEELFSELTRLGFRAIAYMPPRNTREQLLRVQRLCAAHGLMEISGVDINSPRQSFNCPEILAPEFSHLVTATWALIAHENLADADPRLGLFRPDNPLARLPLAQRISRYAEVGEGTSRERPEEAVRHPVVAAWGKGA
jgi:hypothetical protein